MYLLLGSQNLKSVTNNETEGPSVITTETVDGIISQPTLKRNLNIPTDKRTSVSTPTAVQVIWTVMIWIKACRNEFRIPWVIMLAYRVMGLAVVTENKT